MNNPKPGKEDTPMRASEALTFEPAACWERLQAAKSEFFFEDLDGLMKERHQQFLEELMSYERQCFLNAHPYERTEQRVDQANGFYRRGLTHSAGGLGTASAPNSVWAVSDTGLETLPAPGAGDQRGVETGVSVGRLDPSGRLVRWPRWWRTQ
ncbi:MAG: transposase [Verrucomicrobiota bacterium]